MKFARISCLLPVVAAVLLLCSFSTESNAQIVQGGGLSNVTLQPCINNPSLVCVIFAAFDSNLAPYWYTNSSGQSNGLGKDPVFMDVNGVLVNGTKSLTNSSYPSQGLWVGLAPVNSTVGYLGGSGDNSTGFGKCNNNNPHWISGYLTQPFSAGIYYAAGDGYSCN